MSGIQLLLNSARGVYIPQNFVEEFDLEKWGISSLKEEIEDCSDPDDDCYWDSWHRIMDYAEFTDSNGYTWRLYQDGDLFAYCPELMSKGEWEGFFPDEPFCKSVDALAKRHDGDLVADGDDMGFSHYGCECCNGLAGNRYRVFGKEVKK